MSIRIRTWTIALISAMMLAGSASATQQASVDFVDDVRPILRRHCSRCHGAKNQEAGLSLSDREAVRGEAASGTELVVPGNADASLLIRRLVDPEMGDLMPLDGEPLPESEIAVLRRWVEQGADWPTDASDGSHWAYRPIVRPEVPALSETAEAYPQDGAGNRGNADFAPTPIDSFVLKRLQRRGWKMSLPADRARMIRRVSLALTGLPPTPKEVDAFVNDVSPNAYEQVVDRLLGSPRYGERWAVPWLDYARYADSNGFQADQLRDNWAYRDWVIRAFNDEMPFDQFVVEQLAGDLLPQATVDQRIATGFHRMTTCNVEAGVHPEANRVNQIVDRVNTTATVFLGTTLECAQCHDHKYDPFSQQDYYRLFAYFNRTPLEVKNTSGVTWDFFGPTMDLPTDATMQQSLATLKNQIDDLQQQRNETLRLGDAEFERWLKKLAARKGQPPRWIAATPEAFSTSGGEDFEIKPDGSVLLSGTVPDTVEHVFTIPADQGAPSAIKIDALTDDSIDGKGPGRGDAKRSNIILSELTVELVGEKNALPVELSSPAADFEQAGWPASAAIDGNRKTGWAISPKFGEPHWISFRLDTPRAVHEEFDRFRVTLGQFYGRGRVMGRPRVSFCFEDASYLNVPEKLLAVAAKKKLTAGDRAKLRREFEKLDPRIRKLDDQIATLKKRLAKLKPDSTLVMVEMEEPRDTFVMVRGDYENLGDKVGPGFPSLFPEDDSIPATGDRLELARRLTSPRNPLLARVTVNRWWGELFGAGLVITPEDFGTQAEAPSHPRLLDWLASELIDSGWSMKHVHKQMVLSHAFRQSAKGTPESRRLDPGNRLLSRGPRFRMNAELIRDNALAIAGVLSDQMYGKPVMPYQPDGIWRSVGRNQPKWVVADNENRLRRGVYVIWKRAAPYPSFINFDAPDRGSCSVSRGRSNTPLQALTLLNDPAYAEIALAFADRVLAAKDSASDSDRIRYAFRMAIAREPTSNEKMTLQRLLDSEREMLVDKDDLVRNRTRKGLGGFELKTPPNLELAAWFAVANVLLNLDETMTQ